MQKNDLGFFRVAAGVPRVFVGNPIKNVTEMADMTRRIANHGKGQAVVYPELGITGYSCKDYFEQRWLKDASLEALFKYLTLTEDLGIISFVGMPLTVDEQRFNVSVACYGSNILKIRPKIYLANNNEFQEARWFASGENLVSKTINLFGQIVPIGTDVLIDVENCPGLTLTDEICHDLFMPIPPSSFDCMFARIIFNLSASTEKVAKGAYRKSLVENQSARCLAGYVYSSCTSCTPFGSGESTAGAVLGGHALIYQNGNLLAEKPRFQRQEGYIIADIDYDFLGHERENECGLRQAIGHFKKPYRRVKCYVGQLDIKKVGYCGKVKAKPFVPSDPITLEQNCQDIFAIQTAAIGHRLEHIASTSSRRSNIPVSIGISGGLDSALTLISTVKTFDLLGWERKQIRAVTMPGFGTSRETYADAVALCTELGVDFYEISIVDSTIAHLRDIDSFCSRNTERMPCKKCLQCENAQARERTKILMDMGFNLGSGDLSELMVGWCTYNADQTAMYNGNGGIPKSMIQFVLKHVADTEEFGEKVSEILNRIITRAPSPELIENPTGENLSQKTDELIGPLELRDFFTHHFLRNCFSPEKIFFLAQEANKNLGHEGFGKIYKDKEILKWLRIFFKRFFASRFKTENAPDSPQVGTVNLCSRANLRLPPDMDGEEWVKQIEER